jgi:DedD protein
MASTLTPAALEVRRKGRRRLIGAFAIVVAMVVFLPMLLDPAPRQQKQDMSLSIPAKDAVAPLPPPPERPAAKDDARQAPLSEVPKAAPDTPKAAAPAEPSKPLATIPPAPVPAKAAAVAVAATTAAVADPAPAKATEAPKVEGFAVQIGAFKDDARLKQARDKLVAAKVKHYTEIIATSSGDLTRLRAGPYPTREAADKAAQQLKRSGVDGKVVPLP